MAPFSLPGILSRPPLANYSPRLAIKATISSRRRSNALNLESNSRAVIQSDNLVSIKLSCALSGSIKKTCLSFNLASMRLSRSAKSLLLAFLNAASVYPAAPVTVATSKD